MTSMKEVSVPLERLPTLQACVMAALNFVRIGNKQRALEELTDLREQLKGLLEAAVRPPPSSSSSPPSFLQAPSAVRSNVSRDNEPIVQLVVKVLEASSDDGESNRTKAERIADALRGSFLPWTYHLKVPRLSNPSLIVDVTVSDKGDVIPGFDAQGNRYEVFTTWYRCKDEALARYLNAPGKLNELVDYVQTDRCKLEDGLSSRTADMARAWRNVDLDWPAVASQVRLIGDRVP